MSNGAHPTPLDRAAMLRRLDRAAPRFDEADFLFRTTREGMLTRLEPMTLNADVVLDLGCATGAGRAALEKRFRGALVVGCDLSAGMLGVAAQRKRLFSRPALLRADAMQLPLADDSCDLVFANQLLPWLDDLPGGLAEIQRVLRADGLFAFATLGPDSLRLLAARQRDDDEAHVRVFADMHDVGDALVRAGLRDPVLDVERLTVTYRDPSALFRDLSNTGTRNSLAGRAAGLTGKGRWQRFIDTLDIHQSGDVLTLELEIVYGHCWGSGQRPGGREVSIDAAAIPRRGARHKPM